MKSTRGAMAPYKPGPPPANLPPEVQRYLDEELSRIAGLLRALSAWASTANARLLAQDPSNSTEPANPTQGMLVYTDGVTWNPGSGEGYYYYNSNGDWNPLG